MSEQAPRARPEPGRVAGTESAPTLAGAALALIHTGQAPTRAALTSALGVTRTTAGTLTADLSGLRLVKVDGSGPVSGKGRPSHRIRIDPAGPVVLAAQVHADGYAVALAELGGRIVVRKRSPATSDDPGRLLGLVAAAGAKLIAAEGRPCAGAGLAVPSAMAEPAGTADRPLYLGWPPGTPVRAIFAGQLAEHGIGVPCSAANDINLAALAEHRHGAGRGARYLLVLATGHRGVGSALVLGGELYAGSSGHGMEAGHLSVDPLGRPCRCGKRGCLDTETDHLALLHAAGRVPGDDPRAQARALLREDTPAARAAAGRLIDLLGRGLANLINVLNPDRVLLGGLHKHLLAAGQGRLRAAVHASTLGGRSGSVPLLACQLRAGGLVGAAELAWLPVLADPRAALAGAGLPAR